ncbi:hypothetical protein, partial [Escherichia coli]|uniref:hypothetical protein n=1 Tax=Escherichia coli TaxID=562 RepID=UPI001BDD6DBC
MSSRWQPEQPFSIHLLLRINVYPQQRLADLILTVFTVISRNRPKLFDHRRTPFLQTYYCILAEKIAGTVPCRTTELLTGSFIPLESF